MPESLVPLARHAEPRPRALRVALPIGLAFTAVASLWALLPASSSEPVAQTAPPAPQKVESLPDVRIGQVQVLDPCSSGTVADALDRGADAEVVAAFGGGAAFREAVVSGRAPCVSTDDPARNWVVVNKTRPLRPQEFEPPSLVAMALQATTNSVYLRPDASAALTALAVELQNAGVGVLGVNNGFRSYNTQVRTYGRNVEAEGQVAADALSARPGFSEHQTGLAVDVVSCAPVCGTIVGFGATAEAHWVAENAWRFGFIVRYTEGTTPTTGYEPEPWHLRYIGDQLAEAYHAGGYATLEEFFGLPAAPDYAG